MPESVPPRRDRDLAVAVTGPTGEIGRALLRALEREPSVARVEAMGRRAFDPAAAGLAKVRYRRGDVTDRAAVHALVDGADVVVHLAFAIFDRPEAARAVNVTGSRNVFEAALHAGARRLVYTSSIAAYGFHEDTPAVVNEEHPARGSDDHPYSAQKADVERMLDNVARGRDADVYVFRPCIVAGPTATMLVERIPYVGLQRRMPGPLRRAVAAVPALRPVIPDPGVPFQLVHEDDVAHALVRAITGAGPPGTYNLAADGEVTLSELAEALGYYRVRVPSGAVEATATIVSRMPMLPVETRWIAALRVPLRVDCANARVKLGWAPRYDARATLAALVAGARERGLLPWPGRAP
ncbi:MAG TPA: NAD-dependent epimerase/dehydratase family protein [Actinomycetota bacterium]|nr:NAD-dependent epimerase/dehydratase family protein [Actinomycetota bacterium]